MSKGPCYMCGDELALNPRAEPGSPYPYRCPACGGQCTGWFAADGREYDDRNDDLDGRPPWDPDYDGPRLSRSEWSVKNWAEVSMPETPLCRDCAARLVVAGYGAHVLTLLEHESSCAVTARPGEGVEAGQHMRTDDEELWQQIVAERGDEPTPCCYCGTTTRPFSEWAAGARCRCGGTWYSVPPYGAGEVWYVDTHEDEGP